MMMALIVTAFILCTVLTSKCNNDTDYTVFITQHYTDLHTETCTSHSSYYLYEKNM